MKSIRFRCAVAAAFLCLLLLGGGPVPAKAERGGARGEAAALTRDAARAEANGDLTGAVALYQRAATLTRDPDLFEKLARTLATLGRAQDEASAWHAFLEAAAANDPQRSEAEARIAILEGWIAQTALDFAGLPEGARLFVDGRPLGPVTNDEDVRVLPGQHTIIVRADGYEDYQTTVVSPVGGVVRVDVVMATLAPRPVLPVTLWVVGGAALAAGGALGPIAFRRSGHQAIDTPAGERTRRMAIGSDALLATGAAFVLVGGALYYFCYREPAAEGSAALELLPFVGPSAVGITVRGAL